MNTERLKRIKTHLIRPNEAKKYGVQKAAIIENTVNFHSECEESELSELFPYIEEKEFNKLFKEILEAGILLKLNGLWERNTRYI